MDRTYEFRAGDRSADAVLAILRQHSHIIRSKINVVLADQDVEALHDLRVATRRTRTALSQTTGVLPSIVVDHFLPEFKRLASVTSRHRDLDVFLVEVAQPDSHRGVSAGDLARLRLFIEDIRRVEHIAVCETLSSNSFEGLLGEWSRFLDSGTHWEPEPPLASTAIIDVASPSILKSYRRIRKRGADVTADTLADVFHRIRIDGKKLRYLLEFFSDLYPRKRIVRFIKALKRLQDILGEFNDTTVWLALIDEFLGSDVASSNDSAAAVHLTATFKDRQKDLRQQFIERFDIFAGDDSRRSYRKTFRVR